MHQMIYLQQTKSLKIPKG